MIQVVLTMDTLDLVPFEGTQLQRVEDFDASKFHIKELRIKDLHKDLCKKPYFHVRLDSEKRTTSVAEQAGRNVEQRRSSIVSSDAEYETCEEDAVASVPQDPILPSLSEKTRREEFPGEEPEPAHRHSKRKTRLPGKFRHDDSILSDFSERYVRHLRRGVPKSKVKLSRLKENPQPVQTQFFEVPIEAHEESVLQGDASGAPRGGERIGSGSSKIADSDPCTPSDRKAPAKPLKQIYHAPSSGQSRHPPYRARSSGQRRPLPAAKRSKVSVDYTECMELSSDSDQPEGPGRTPKTSSVKRKTSSTDATIEKEAPSTGKRVLDGESKEKGSKSINGSKSREYKGRSLESGLKRTHTALDGSTEKILPMRWRPSAPDASASVEEIAPTEKMGILESKWKETKSRLHNSNPKEKNGKTFESEWNRSHNAPPQARTEEPILTKRRHNSSGESAGKRAFEGKSNEKERMTAEDKWKAKKGRTPERETKQGHGAPDARVEDILPMKWRLPKENLLFESKSKEKNGRSSAHSAEIRPLKRKRSHIQDPGVEDIPPPEKKKTAGGKLKEKASEAPETMKEKKARTTNSESKQKSNGTSAKSRSARRLGTPIRKLKSGYTSEDGNSNVERNAADGPGTSYPTFATEMKHSNVITCFWMGIPSEFCSRHMPDHDQFVVLQDAKGLKWEANYLARKKGLSGGWRRFSLDHHLDMGDIVVFELVKPQKFLVHITKGSGVENTTGTAHRPARETPKKVEKPKHQASTSTKRPPSFKSALFSGRKRVNKDAEGKSSSKKPRFAGEDSERRKVEERAKRNYLFHSGGSTKKKRESASEATDRHEYALLSSSGEESEAEENDSEGHRARPSLPKFKHLSSKGDDRKNSNTRKNPSPELPLPLTIYEESPVTPSAEPRKAGPTSPRSGPPKKKLRRVSYFYSTDDDQG